MAEGYNNGYCGLNIDSQEDLDHYLASGFHFVFTPLALVDPGSSSGLNFLKWSNRVIGKISSWIDLDSDDEIIRTKSERTLRDELDLASKLSLQVCLLPAPRSSSCGNYARCVNQILQNLSSMQLLLRIPLEESDDNDNKAKKLKHTGECPADSLNMWKSFRHLCEHNNRLSVAFDFQSSLPSVNSLGCWLDEPLSAAIIDSRIFQGVYLDMENCDKLMVWLLNNSIKIVVSCPKIQAPSATNFSDHDEASLLYAICHYKLSLCREDQCQEDDEDEDFVSGTTLFAMKYNNGVVLGADSRMTGHTDGSINDTGIKQFLIGRSICLAFKGPKSQGYDIVNKLRIKFIETARSMVGITTSLVAEWTFDMLKNVKEEDVVQFIIDGAQNGKAELHKVSPDENSRVDMAIFGNLATSAVEISKNIPLQTREEAKNTVFEGIKRAKLVSYTTGGDIKLLFIEDDGSRNTETAVAQDPLSSVTRYDWVVDDFVPDSSFVGHR